MTDGHPVAGRPPRVAVVGGGLAGAAACLELARAGAEAVLVAGAPGATALGWGTLDVAPAVPGSRRLRWRSPLRDEPLSSADRLAVLTGTYPRHPYAVLWQRTESLGDAAMDGADLAPAEFVKQSVEALDASLAPHGLRVSGGLDANRLLADVHGALRVSDYAFTGPADGDLATAHEVVWVGLRGLAGVAPRAAVRSVAAELAALGVAAPPIRLAELRLPEGLPVDPPARLAAALDAPEGRAALRHAVGDLAAREGGPGRLFLLPPVLGIDGVAEALAMLREVLRGPVAEQLAAVPVAVPGFRLARALDAACAAAGVARHAGRATSVRVEAGRAAGVSFRPDGEDAERALAADAVILATGRFLAGGLEEGPRGVREPLLDLPLFDDRGDRVDGLRPRAAVRPRYLDAQPLFSAGVRVDARLRPLATADPAPGRDAAVLPGLFAAGDLLGGFDPARQRTGLGVALVTGRRAAGQALLSAQRSRAAEAR